MRMTRFLLAGRLDGQLGALARLQTLVQERRPHGVLFAGGILAGDGAAPAAKRQTWQDFFDGMGKLGVFTALIPGSADGPLRDFLRVARQAEVDNPNVHTAHATLFEEPNVAVDGLGGELTETEDCTEERLCCARASAEYFLRTLWWAEQPQKVLLLSVPPPGALGGDAGNRVCGDFIDSYHPALCVVAGTSDRRGFQRVGHTLVVNPGRLADGSLAWLDWERHKDEQVEFLPAGIG